MKALVTALAVSAAVSLSLLAEGPEDGEQNSVPEKAAAGKALRCLLVTGGCCHDYDFQSKALTLSSAAKADIDWTVVNKGGRGTRA